MEMVIATISSMISVAMFGAAFIGYVYAPLAMWQRVSLFFGALCIIGQNPIGNGGWCGHWHYRQFGRYLHTTKK